MLRLKLNHSSKKDPWLSINSMGHLNVVDFADGILQYIFWKHDFVFNHAFIPKFSSYMKSNFWDGHTKPFSLAVGHFYLNCLMIYGTHLWQCHLAPTVIMKYSLWYSSWLQYYDAPGMHRMYTVYTIKHTVRFVMLCFVVVILAILGYLCITVMS